MFLYLQSGIAAFVDPSQDPQYYVDRYNTEATYKDWFDKNYPECDSIYQAVGLEEPVVEEPKIGERGPGTNLVDGKCELRKIWRRLPYCNCHIRF